VIEQDPVQSKNEVGVGLVESAAPPRRELLPPVYHLVREGSIDSRRRPLGGLVIFHQTGKHPDGVERGRRSETIFVSDPRFRRLGGKRRLEPPVLKRDMAEAGTERL
jgi:hypothetical protein